VFAKYQALARKKLIKIFFYISFRKFSLSRQQGLFHRQSLEKQTVRDSFCFKTVSDLFERFLAI
jgi:hypothetical protein